MRAWRYFKVKILPITHKCTFCPLPRALRPWEPCPCPYLNTRRCIFESELRKKEAKEKRLQCGGN